jgi:hypothetical protein
VKDFAIGVLILLLVCSLAFAQQEPRRLFIVELTEQGTTAWDRNVTYSISDRVGANIMKQCPNIVSITKNEDQADFHLEIKWGGSPLYNRQGDIVYYSPASHKEKNIAKDICNYLKKH